MTPEDIFSQLPVYEWGIFLFNLTPFASWFILFFTSVDPYQQSSWINIQFGSRSGSGSTTLSKRLKKTFTNLKWVVQDTFLKKCLFFNCMLVVCNIKSCSSQIWGVPSLLDEENSGAAVREWTAPSRDRRRWASGRAWMYLSLNKLWADFLRVFACLPITARYLCIGWAGILEVSSSQADPASRANQHPALQDDHSHTQDSAVQASEG